MNRNKKNQSLWSKICNFFLSIWNYIESCWDYLFKEDNPKRNKKRGNKERNHTQTIPEIKIYSSTSDNQNYQNITNNKRNQYSYDKSTRSISKSNNTDKYQKPHTKKSYRVIENNNTPPIHKNYQYTDTQNSKQFISFNYNNKQHNNFDDNDGNQFNTFDDRKTNKQLNNVNNYNKQLNNIDSNDKKQSIIFDDRKNNKQLNNVNNNDRNQFGIFENNTNNKQINNFGTDNNNRQSNNFNHNKNTKQNTYYDDFNHNFDNHNHNHIQVKNIQPRSKSTNYHQSSNEGHRPLSKEDKDRQKIGQETTQIVNTGKLTIYDKSKKQLTTIDIKDKINWCNRNTETIRPDQSLPIPHTISKNSPMARIEVTTESSFGSLYRLKIQLRIKETCILNFASATKPGGGYLNGRGAQEETLCRQSSLYQSLISQPEMYNTNKMNYNGPYYTDYMIYSPNVVFFRNDNYAFVNPFRASVITSPAVNYAELLNSGQNPKKVQQQVYEVMKTRCKKIIRLAISKGNRALILGAFGCGVFKNPPEMISQIFKELLYDAGYGRYLTNVVFPIYSPTGRTDGHSYNVFKSALQNV